MPVFYSPSTGGFYDDAIHAVLPDDAAGISVEDHQALLLAQSEGKIISADSEGHPVAADQPAPPEAQLLAALRQERDRLLRESDRTQIPDYPISAEDRAAWAAYRQQLRDLPETT